MKKLSIIIPAYNAEPYLTDLLNCLKKQMTPEAELIIVDDGSKEPVKCDFATVIRERNGSPGISRNIGLEKMTGEYFTFIDADDLVADNYVETILKKIEDEKFDYCYLSWKTLPGGWQCSIKLTDIEDKFPPYNLCVWNRVYKRSKFGKHRFNPKKLWSEDADYIYRLNERGKKAFISDFMYFYRSDTPGSWTKRMFNGELNYTRIVYNVKTVSEELRDKIKREYENNEIVLLTNDNPYEELSKYAMIMDYCQPVSGTILRGDSYSGFRQIPKAIITQVVIYTAVTEAIGGIETFIYNFCYHMREYYDILVLYQSIDAAQLRRLQKLVRCEKLDLKKKIKCDTLIINRISDKSPDNITYSKKVQMCHSCKLMKTWTVPQDNDLQVFVSEAAKETFKSDIKEHTVIHNLTIKDQSMRALILISATRLGTFEKGRDRIKAFARCLSKNKIPFLWIIFTDQPIQEEQNIICLKPTLNISSYIMAADYLVQLSDSEGFCYSLVEALSLGVPVLTTPISVLPEIGFEDEKNGYIIPFEIKEDYDIKRILNVPRVDYEYDNDTIVDQWREVLGYTVPTHSYRPPESVTVFVVKEYRDIELDRVVKYGEYIEVSEDRARKIEAYGFGRKV